MGATRHSMPWGQRCKKASFVISDGIFECRGNRSCQSDVVKRTPIMNIRFSLYLIRLKQRNFLLAKDYGRIRMVGEPLH